MHPTRAASGTFAGIPRTVIIKAFAPVDNEKQLLAQSQKKDKKSKFKTIPENAVFRPQKFQLGKQIHALLEMSDKYNNHVDMKRGNSKWNVAVDLQEDTAGNASQKWSKVINQHATCWHTKKAGGLPRDMNVAVMPLPAEEDVDK